MVRLRAKLRSRRICPYWGSSISLAAAAKLFFIRRAHKLFEPNRYNVLKGFVEGGEWRVWFQTISVHCIHTRTFYDCLNTRRRRLIYTPRVVEIFYCNVTLRNYTPDGPPSSTHPYKGHYRRRDTRKISATICYTNIFLFDDDEDCGDWRNNGEITKGDLFNGDSSHVQITKWHCSPGFGPKTTRRRSVINFKACTVVCRATALGYYMVKTGNHHTVV